MESVIRGGVEGAAGVHLQDSFPPTLPRNSRHLERLCWIEWLMSLERWYWLTKGQQRPMQLSDKKTYSVKDCVNKGTLQHRPDKGQSRALSGAPLFAVGLGSSLRTEGLGGRPWGGGGGGGGWRRRRASEAVWVSAGIRTQGVARLCLRGRWELTPLPMCPGLTGDHGWSASQGGGCWEEGALVLLASVWFGSLPLVLTSFRFLSLNLLSRMRLIIYIFLSFCQFILNYIMLCCVISYYIILYYILLLAGQDTVTNTEMPFDWEVKNKPLSFYWSFW